MILIEEQAVLKRTYSHIKSKFVRLILANGWPSTKIFQFALICYQHHSIVDRCSKTQYSAN